jgi:enoyl-CoA hydratase/carnithine racemase
MIDIEQQDEVAVVHWSDDENRFNRASVERWHDVLDELEAVEGPLAVVVVGEGRIFSNGLDLDSFASDPDDAGAVVDEVHRLFGRFLVFPAHTAFALNGHSFAAGAMLSCCADVRVMREDRGYWCLPEVDLGLPLTEPMVAVVTARLTVSAAAEAMNTGRRYTAAEAVTAGIVEHAVPEAEVLERAIALAAPLAAKDRNVIAQHKRMLFGGAARICGHTA